MRSINVWASAPTGTDAFGTKQRRRVRAIAATAVMALLVAIGLPLATMPASAADAAAVAVAPSTPDLVAASDSGRSSTDNITNEALPTFTGTIEGFTGPEVSVDLLVDGVATPAVTTVNGTYTVTLTAALAPGPHSVLAESAGLQSGLLQFTLDRTAPVVTLGSHPTSTSPVGPIATADNTPTFTFTSNDPGATFACQLQRSLPASAACASPKAFAAQVDGDYVFVVRAIDVAGNVSRPEVFGWRIAVVTRLSDFNRDARTDLVARDRAGRLWLYPGNGTGGFLTRRLMGTGWNVFTAIVTPGDVTGDGNGDVLVRTASGTMRVFPGNGRGGFGASRQVGTGWNAMNVITSAADTTGAFLHPDLFARDRAGQLWLYPMAGNAGFQSRHGLGAGWSGMTSILGPGDLSGDARPDLLARDRAGKLWLYRGTGAGGGGFATRTSAGTGWQGMTALVTPGNWDRTGGNDLIARDAAGRLWLYPGNNAGQLTPRRQIGIGFRGYTIA